MEFIVNVGKMLKSLNPVMDVATKNTLKDFDSAYNITLESTDDGIEAIAYGGLISISVDISDKYIDNLKYQNIKSGKITANAKKLFESIWSFPPSENVKIEVKEKDGAGSIYIISMSDPEQFQTLPFEKQEVVLPAKASKFETEVVINREIFINGMQKVNFAIGYEENRPQYLCQVFDVDSYGARFIAGTGARFAVDKIIGKNISDTKSKKRIIFPKNNISNLITILKMLTTLEITIKEAFSSNSNPDQIVIEVDGIVITILGIDPNMRNKYVDIDKIVEFDHPNKIETDLSEWEYPTRGIITTYSEEMRKDNDIHNAEIVADFKKLLFNVKADVQMKSGRKIKFTNVKSKNNDVDNVLLRCNSMYLSEIVKEGGSNGIMNFRFIDQGSPIVVDFPEKVNEVIDTTEKYSIFFTTSKK